MTPAILPEYDPALEAFRCPACGAALAPPIQCINCRIRRDLQCPACHSTFHARFGNGQPTVLTDDR